MCILAQSQMASILIIEDNENHRELLRDVLTIEGYNVITASGGRNGLELIKSLTKIDLILCDWLMPGITGIQVLAEFQALYRNKKIPFIMVSAYAEDYNKKLASELGADEYIVKPYNFNEILEIIKKYV